MRLLLIMPVRSHEGFARAGGRGLEVGGRFWAGGRGVNAGLLISRALRV